MSIKPADKVGDLKFKKRFAWFPVEIDDFVIQWESYYECQVFRKLEIPIFGTHAWMSFKDARAKGLKFSNFKERCREGVKRH